MVGSALPLPEVWLGVHTALNLKLETDGPVDHSWPPSASNYSYGSSAHFLAESMGQRQGLVVGSVCLPPCRSWFGHSKPRTKVSLGHWVLSCSTCAGTGNQIKLFLSLPGLV